MKIFGIGTDIVNVKRMEKSLKKNGLKFKNRVFSKKEINYCERKKNPYTFYAKRFAAKEALSKALGTGIRKGINLKNIEILGDIYRYEKISTDLIVCRAFKKLKEILGSIGIPSGMSVIIRTAGIGKIKKEIKKDLDFLVNQWNFK